MLPTILTHSSRFGLQVPPEEHKRRRTDPNDSQLQADVALHAELDAAAAPDGARHTTGIDAILNREARPPILR